MEEALNSLYTWGYLAIAFFSFGGSLLIVAAAGVFSAMGKIDIGIALGVAALFNFLGDNFLFYMARYQKGYVKPYFKKFQRKIALSHILFKKYGNFVIFIKKYIYGIKTLIPLSMGLSKYPFIKFIIYNFLASIFFVLSVGLTGYYASGFIISIFNEVTQKPWIAPVVLFGILGIIWLAMHKATKK